MHPVRFELTPPERTELESVALDHSAMDAIIYIQYMYIYMYIKYIYIYIYIYAYI